MERNERKALFLIKKNIKRIVKSKNCIQEGDKILFTSGNYQGMTAVVSKVDFTSKNKNAIYGYYHDVILSNGKVGHIEKSEHWEFI
jgi:transcription antitermination factor NusG